MLQVAAVCDHIASIPQLSQGYNAVGFSQGSQFLRAVLERCQHNDGMPKMHKLITLGGQHQGIMNGPACSGPSFNQTPSTACKAVQRILGFGAYLPWIRSHIIQAQYFKVSVHASVSQSGALCKSTVNFSSHCIVVLSVHPATQLNAARLLLCLTQKVHSATLH